jgi:ATP-dependent DNA helicase RecG
MIFDSCTPIIDPEITMISHVTALNIKTVIESFSGEEVFGRKEIKERLELIKAVRGQGKGKYCFDI